MIVMIVMMYVLVDVSSTGRGRHRILREFTFEPTHDLRHRSGLVLLPRGVLQLMLLARSTTLRMNELRVIALQIVVIVGNGLMIGRLLIIIGNEVDDVAMNIAATVGML